MFRLDNAQKAFDTHDDWWRLADGDPEGLRVLISEPYEHLLQFEALVPPCNLPTAMRALCASEEVGLSESRSTVFSRGTNNTQIN